jgi:uridylate kinase
VVIDRLSKQLAGVYAADPANKPDADRINHVLKEVTDIKTGAFASYLQQPVLQSLLVPLGGISEVKVLEFLANLG